MNTTRPSFPWSARLPLLIILHCVLGGCATAFTVGRSTTVLREPSGFHARERLYLHEEIHRVQYRRLGTLRMLAVYSLSESQRLELEAEAYAAELCYLVRVGTSWPEAWRLGFVEALRTYTMPRITRTSAESFLDHAYRDGAACNELLGWGGRQWVLTAYPGGRS